MIYSNACAYAIRAMTRLAMLRPDGYVLLDELCEGTDLPRHFVAKIFQDLVRKGLLTSAKGRGGGFALANPPSQITLYDIVAQIDGVESLDSCVVGLAKCDDEQPCPQHEQWKPIRAQLKKFLLSTTLEMMAEAMSGKMELVGMPKPELKSKSKPLARG
ncbi:MAG: Rrf2 family transcriptional regulator [Phycisphaeraceae bacterium]